MATVNRTALLTKAHKVLKKYFKPVSPHPDRPVLEQLLFACCLENAPYEPAEEVFARLGELFFDWNEVRVSTVPELAAVMGGLHDPREAATRLKRVLQGVFEATYSFDLEFLRKMNLGQAIQKLQKMTASSPFAASYVTQSSLGGHSIPIDRGAAEVCEVLGVISAAERATCNVPGIDRAIPKNKGIEFGSLLHQLGAQIAATPLSPAVHKILLEIDPECRDRLPKRQSKKKPEPPARKAAEVKGGAKNAAKPGTDKAPAAKSGASAAKPGMPAAKSGAPTKGALKDAPSAARKGSASSADKGAADKDRAAKAKKGAPDAPVRKTESVKKPPAPVKRKPAPPAKKKPAATKSNAALPKRKPR